jgi:chemotaxis protein methyltransferase CheR
VSAPVALDAASLTPTPSEFRRISQLAYEKFGLCLRDGKETLVAARLGKRVRQGGFRSFAEYHRHVISDPTGEALIELIDSLTTNYTCFLRERPHFDFLTKAATSEFRDYGGLRLWSAACSSGEEPYSLAMCLLDAARAGGIRWAQNLRILATDISVRVLAKAKRGVYEAERFRAIPDHWWRSYVLRGEGTCAGFYKVKPEIAKCVEFDRLNLMEPFPRGTFHAIFCRNVMMYFDKPTQQGIVTRLTECIESGGYLFVGHSETLTGIDHDLSYVRPAVYRKRAFDERRRP